MLTLDLSNAPQWCDLIPGVRVRLRPLTTALMVAARGDPAIADLPEGVATEEAALAMAKALARRAILAWEGIGDADGTPIEPSPEAIDALLDLWPAFEAFQTAYVAKALLLDAKKRLCALADWSFGGGEGYCAACGTTCPDCPARLNQPLTLEGVQVWDLAQRLGGQMRVIPGAVIGWDMGAALALGNSLGISPPAIAELLPALEAVMVRRVNEQIAANRD
jgi:hypothetical protein